MEAKLADALTIAVGGTKIILFFNPAKSSVKFNSTLCCKRSNVEHKHISQSLKFKNKVKETIKTFHSVLCWLSILFCYLVAAFELLRLEIFW
jgi:hypothetical protein